VVVSFGGQFAAMAFGGRDILALNQNGVEFV
jgi:hypothetical protein